MVVVKLNVPSPKSAGGWIKDRIIKLGPKKIVIIIVTLAIGITGGYYWRNNQSKNQLGNSVNDLKSQVAELQKTVAGTNNTSTTTPTTTPTTPPQTTTSVAPSADILASISAAMTSGDANPLTANMAAAVQVDIAGSASLGSRPPAQAVSDVAFLKSGTAPWNFALAADVLAKYRAGNYKQFFPETAYIGSSANGYVVSFQFDATGKISGIFMSAPNIL